MPREDVKTRYLTSLHKGRFNKTMTKKIIFSIILIAVGIIGRFVFKDIPGETMTAVTLLSGALLGRRYALPISLIIIAASDMIIGNSPILLFTWSSWVLIGLFGAVSRQQKKVGLKFTAEMTGLGLVSTLFFYLWTNFGVWIIGDWYPHTALGLYQSYIMGLPFLREQFLGNLIIVPVAAILFGFAWEKVRIKKRVGQKEFTAETKKV